MATIVAFSTISLSINAPATLPPEGHPQNALFLRQPAHGFFCGSLIHVDNAVHLIFVIDLRQISFGPTTDAWYRRGLQWAVSQ